MKKYIKNICIVALGIFSLSSCNDFLDREPLDKVTPEAYFNNEGDLATYTANLYPNAGFSTIPPGHYGLSTFKSDNNTDNQADPGGDKLWLPGEWRVTSSDKSWNFSMIRSCNYFLEKVLPKYTSNAIKGNEANIKQFIGEVYAIRANVYFDKLQTFGDFPIITQVLPDEKNALVKASERRPINEVARFILSDLDKAIDLLGDTSPNGKNRLTKDAAYILKSRVALYVGTWLKYHKGTAQVPGGPGWPGAKESYLSGFTIDIDSEIKFFLEEAKASAKVVADKMIGNLTTNTGDRVGFDSKLTPKNPYFDMFAANDMDAYKEVIFWRKYSEKEQTHNVQMNLGRNGGGSGYTKGMVDSYLMKNGLPIYAPGSGYAGDDYQKDVLNDRDDRLQLFTKIKGDIVYYNDQGEVVTATSPKILDPAETRNTTGYGVKKGLNYSMDAESHHKAITGSIIFRGVEAMLNYMEANYVLDQSIDGSSTKYWQAIRARAKVDTDFNKTIGATDMNKEKEGDFGAYSAGSLIDETLYNIRRERRNEFIAEGMRWADLKRWRALDQLKSKPYVIQGFKVWGPMKNWYKDDKGESRFKTNSTTGGNNVSPETKGEYLRPHQLNKVNNPYYDGYKWNDAHYLSPIPMDAFRLTETTEGDLNSSVIYQNPGWSKIAGESIL